MTTQRWPMIRTSWATPPLIAYLLSVATLTGVETVALAEKGAPGEAASQLLPGSSEAPLPPRALVRLGTLGLREESLVRSISWSADGSTIASAGQHGGVRLWDAATGDERSVLLPQRDLPQGDAFLVACSPSGKKLAATGTAGAYLWDLQKSQKPDFVDSIGGPLTHCLAFSPDGTLLALAYQGGAILWDVRAGKIRSQLDKRGGDVFAVAFSHDGKCLAFAGGGVGFRAGDTSIQIWNVAESKTTLRLEGHRRQVHSVAFSPDGKTLASASLDGTIRIWDLVKGELVRRMDSPGYLAAFSPDGKMLASCGPQSDKILFFDPKTGEQILKIEHGCMGIESLAFSPDGKTLATAGDSCAIRLWDTSTGKEILPGVGHRGPVYTVAFSPDGKTLASRAGDSTVRLWDVASGKQRHVLPYGKWGGDGVCSLAFTPDGKQLIGLGGAVFAPDGAYHLWDVASGDWLADFQGPPYFIASVAIAPDGDTTATAGLRGVYLWSLGARRRGAYIGSPGPTHPAARAKTL